MKPALATDAQYLAAVKSGSVEWAQQMVDAAAKAAGYTVVGYHGAGNAPSFTVFKGESAAGWFSQKAGLALTRYGGRKKLIKAFLSFQNLLDLTKIKGFDADNILDAKYVYESAKLPAPLGAKYRYGKPIYETVHTQEFVSIAKAAGFDGIKMIENGNVTWGVFSPSQIKLADPVTYDKSGKVIPLSQRFDTGREEITNPIMRTSDSDYLAAVKAGATAKVQQMVDAAAKAAGYTIDAFHGTDEEFTVFDMSKAGSSTGGFLPIRGMFFSNNINHSSHLGDGQQNKRKIRVKLRFKNAYIGKNWNSLDKMMGGDFDQRPDEGLFVLKSKGYDGYILDGGEEMLAIDPSQIKLADPVTYDKQGKVIPLSKRFDSSSEEITNPVVRTSDSDYLAAVKAGFTAKAQQMVDAAAKAAGYTVGPMWHGSPSSFNIFQKTKDPLGFHFGNRDASNQAKSTTGKKGEWKTRSFFLNIKNPLRLPDLDSWNFFDLRSALVDTGVIPEELPAWKIESEGRGDLRKGLVKRIQQAGYDGVVYKNKFEGVGDSLIAFDPSQIKLADPITYDKSGKVIPLSQRFDSGREEITNPAGRIPAQFPYEYASYLKQHFPEIWKLGGNIRGNDAFRWWTAYRQGDRSPTVMHWWSVTRPAWIARHYRDHLIAGVVAQIKWGTIGSLGVAGMKRVVETKIRNAR